MIGDLFDSPWKVLIVAIVLIVLFGSKKLPDAARSLGKSMRILKTEVGSMHEDETTSPPHCLRRSGRFPAAAEIVASQQPAQACRADGPAARPVAGADRRAAAADP